MGNGSLRMSSDRQDVNGLTIRSLLMAEITGVGDGSYDFRAGRLCNSRYVILGNGSLACIGLGVSIVWMVASFHLVTYSYVTFLCIKS